MRTIHKYEIQVNDTVTLNIPGLLRLLSIGKQLHQVAGVFSLWALVDVEGQIDADDHEYTYIRGPKEMAEFQIQIRGTGHPVQDDLLSNNVFWDTVIDGQFVWHIWVPESFHDKLGWNDDDVVSMKLYNKIERPVV